MLSLILVLIVFGVVLYLIDLIPMDPTVKRVIQILAVLLMVLYTIEVLFGLVLPLPARLPR